MMPSDLLGLTEFEQYEDAKTDTVIYGFNKLVKLLLECNPNTCEMLGLDDNHLLPLNAVCSFNDTPRSPSRMLSDPAPVRNIHIYRR